MQIFVTTTYERATRKLISESVRKEMEAAIVANPGREDLTPADKKALSRLVAKIKQEEKNR